jgi:hypothetical protein
VTADIALAPALRQGLALDQVVRRDERRLLVVVPEHQQAPVLPYMDHPPVPGAASGVRIAHRDALVQPARSGARKRRCEFGVRFHSRDIGESHRRLKTEISTSAARETGE